MQTDIDLQIFCRNIQTLRKQNNLSQKEMAQKLGISVASLRKLEQNRLPPRMSCAVFVRIWQEFGVKPSAMFQADKL